MKPKTYSNQEINQIVLDESTILSIKWINENGIDVEMDVDWCGQEDLKDEIDFLKVDTKLVFKFVCDMDFNFKHNDIWTIGALQITEFSYAEIDKMYNIEFRFDFQPVGFIKFKCNDFKFIVTPKSTEAHIPKGDFKYNKSK